MQNSNLNIKLNFSTLLGITFFLIIFLSIIFRSTVFDFIINLSGTEQIIESQKASRETAELLLSLDKINFNTSILNSSYFNNLQPLPEFPIDAQTLSNFGKRNPFLGNFTIVSGAASATVGAVIYSNQQSTNNGAAITSVRPSR